ncbi:MAG: putative mannose-phosphate guanylyltransferase [Acidimicrobiaceae bacterium]|nr:putative mannose-phosphate guanylyltransferase [Acidimicrobiaceae bacterium]
MQALVLVGGQGTRLRPLTYDVPKPMLPVVGRPMIARVIEWLGLHGVHRVVFCLGYRSDAFVEAFADGHWAGVELEYAVEDEPLDTAGAIRFGAMQGGLTDERFLVVNGDILTDLDLSGLLAFHLRHGGEATIALTPVEDPSAYGVVPTDDDGRVIAFIEKPPRGEAPTNLINAGTYVLEPSVIDRIEPGRRVSIEREVFPALVKDRQLYAMASDVYWLDTGTPERYLQAQLDVLGGSRPLVLFPDHLMAESGARLAPGARMDGELSGYCFMGPDAYVAPGAQVADCVLGEGVRVESGARVVGSVILDGAIIEEGAVVERSLVGPGVKVGAGARVHSLSVLGSGASVMPGAVLDSARLPV